MPDPTFDTLLEDTARLDWPAAAEMRRRARRSALRARVVAATVATVVAGVLAAAALAVDDRDRPNPPVGETRTPVPSQSSSPEQPSPGSTATVSPSGPPKSASPAPLVLTKVPLSAMLQPVDAGAGQWNVRDNVDEGDWTLAAIIGYCPAHPGGWIDPVDRRVREISRLADRPSDGVAQEMGLYRRGTVGEAFDNYRRGAIACAQHTSELNGTAITVRILAERFAGERSMLVEATSQYGRTLWVFVVEGVLMTQLTFEPATTAYGEQLAERAAKRMCAAQETCS